MKLAAPTPIAVLLALTGLVTGAQAHDTDLASREIKPRIGQISDEVARERLVVAGLERPEVLSRDGEHITARATQNGQTLTVRINALTGVITDAQDATRKLSALPGMDRKPAVLNSQLGQTREQIADKALMPAAVVSK